MNKGESHMSTSGLTKLGKASGLATFDFIWIALVKINMALSGLEMTCYSGEGCIPHQF